MCYNIPVSFSRVCSFWAPDGRIRLSNSVKNKGRSREEKRLQRKINTKTSRKLVGLFMTVLLALVGLAGRITYINATEGQQYKRIVMSQAQQQYDSRTIPFQRGTITDRNGTVLAASEKVYNVILDCNVVNSEVEDADGKKSHPYQEPTITALVSILQLNEADIRARLTDESTKNSQYQILKKGITITGKKAFEAYTDLNSEENQGLSEADIRERSRVKGVWFEEDYVRSYPLGSLACDLLGFTYDGVTADWGVEGYYSDILNGTNGRQYGYFNRDADVEQTIIPAVPGKNLTLTIDAGVQQILRHALEIFNEEMATDDGKTNGAQNIGVVVMDPNTGEILGMDSNYWYDLNDPRDLGAFYSRKDLKKMNDDQKMDALFKIWGNYCVTEAFEPGSVFKPMTASASLETGAVKGEGSFFCDGGEQVYDKYIQCDIWPGEHGKQTLRDAIKNSCNDSLMQMADAIGIEDFCRYQDIFNFGSRTGIDLPGEGSGLVYDIDTMGPVEMATCAFGQGFTCTMIQETAAVSSIINGGYYYKPHVVRQITGQSGEVVQEVTPTVERRTVCQATAEQIRDAMGAVLEEGGTGYVAKIPGYTMGGKTGTAEKLPRGQGNYLLDFIGFAPLNDPQVVVYAVVDEPNTKAQETSIYAISIVRNVMMELLPYLGLFPDEAGYDTSNLDNELCTNGTLLAGQYDRYPNGIHAHSGLFADLSAYETEEPEQETDEWLADVSEDDSGLTTEGLPDTDNSGLRIEENLEITDENAGLFLTIDGEDLAVPPEETGEEEDMGNTYYSDGIANNEQEWY